VNFLQCLCTRYIPPKTKHDKNKLLLLKHNSFEHQFSHFYSFQFSKILVHSVVMLKTRIQGLLTYLKFEHLEEEKSKLKIDVKLQKSYLKIEHLEEENLRHWRKLWMSLEKKHFHC